MNIDNNQLNILNNINLHIHKLFSECKDGETFIPPNFKSSSDIDALIVLYQMLGILCNIKMYTSIQNIILYQLLVQIINIKCNEFIEHKWNKNINRFIHSFELYLNTMVDNILIQVK